MKRKEDEPGCVVGDDGGGGAHRVVIGLQAGKLVVVGDEPQPAGEALIVVGVTGVEKHLFVPDDILQEFAVGERGPADIVGGEACQVEPVPREPFGMVREPAPVTLEMDQRGLLPESAYRRENRHGRGGIVEVGGQGGHVGSDRVLLVRIVNALARAGLPAIAARDTEPSAEGARPRDVTEEPRRRAAPQPPL